MPMWPTPNGSVSVATISSKVRSSGSVASSRSRCAVIASAVVVAGPAGEGALLNGTSVFKGKLGQQIASPLLSVRADPRGETFASHEFFDGDGFAGLFLPLQQRGFGHRLRQLRDFDFYDCHF